MDQLTRDALPITELEAKYCSQGDISAKRSPKKYFSHASGSYLFDDNGARFLDFQMFNSAANFGYGSRRHVHAAKTAIETLPGLASEFVHRDRVLLSSEIARRTEARFGVKGRVHFSVGGAQAVDDAIKLVANFTGKRRLLAFEGGYHGRTIAASSISSSYRYRRRFGEGDRASFLPYPYCFRCAYDKTFPDCNYFCVQQLSRLFDTEFHGVIDNLRNSEFGGLVFEPVLGRGGYVVPPPEYFTRIEKVLRENNILLVADEVQMGFYRTGKLWSIEHFGLTPDIIIFGKAITNGVAPLAGVWAREELICPDIWPPGSTHATFAAHPVGTACGLATFQCIDSSELEAEVAWRGSMLGAYLDNLRKRHRIIGRTQQLGLALSVEICQPGSTVPAPELAKMIADVGLQDLEPIEGIPTGLIVTTGGFYNNVLMLSPSLVIRTGEMRLFEHLFERCLNTVESNISL